MPLWDPGCKWNGWPSRPAPPPPHEHDRRCSTRDRLFVDGDRLYSRANGRSFGIGELSLPSLAELRRDVAALPPDAGARLRVGLVHADARDLHRSAANRNALFQVAPQFNLLEMTGPDVSPEDGVTRYIHDHTQGPACATSAGAATIYRNYFAECGGGVGQSLDRQIDCLADLGQALGNEDGRLWTMRNGYALCTEEGLSRIDEALASSSHATLERLRGLLRVGWHRDVEVTTRLQPGHVVSQLFCSAMPVAYGSARPDRWRSISELVLEAAYEATMCVAVLNAERDPSRPVFLTELGGGAFGNDREWIHRAMRRALRLMAGRNLDVRVVSHSKPSAALASLVREFQ